MSTDPFRMAMFEARLGALGRISAFLQEFCLASAIGRETCLRVNLILEELFTNTVRHGHRGDCEAPVWIVLERHRSGLKIAYEDSAPAFNPFSGAPDPALDAPLEERKVGGLGVLVTREFARTCDYSYLYGRNRIELVLDS